MSPKNIGTQRPTPNLAQACLWSEIYAYSHVCAAQGCTTPSEHAQHLHGHQGSLQDPQAAQKEVQANQEVGLPLYLLVVCSRSPLKKCMHDINTTPPYCIRLASSHIQTPYSCCESNLHAI